MPVWNQLPQHQMTRTSATDFAGQRAASEVLAEISRRASHEVRNALNGVAVNIEVVRSRMLQPEPNLAELGKFAERAAQESDAAASLATGLADLTRLLACAVAGKGEASVSQESGMTTLVLPLCSSNDAAVSPELAALGARMSVSVKLSGPAVIFTVRD